MFWWCLDCRPSLSLFKNCPAPTALLLINLPAVTPKLLSLINNLFSFLFSLAPEDFLKTRPRSSNHGSVMAAVAWFFFFFSFQECHVLASRSFLSYAQSLAEKGASVGLRVLFGWFEKSITDWIQAGIQTGNSSLLQGGHSCVHVLIWRQRFLWGNKSMTAISLDGQLCIENNRHSSQCQLRLRMWWL